MDDRTKGGLDMEGGLDSDSLELVPLLSQHHSKSNDAQLPLTLSAYRRILHWYVRDNAYIESLLYYPFLNNRDLGPFASTNDQRLWVHGHGILLDDEKIQNILRNCTWMRFNISAGTKEGYKKMHRADKFDVVKKNIERMVELKDIHGYTSEIGLQSVFVPYLMNKDMLDESKLAVDLGVDYFVIKQCSLPESGKVCDVKFDSNNYDKPEIRKILEECENRSTDKTKIIVKWQALKFRDEKRPYDKCVDAPLLFQVSGDGKCYPCGYLFGDEKYCYGDLHKQTLKEILESERYWKIIDTMINKFDVHKDCKGHCRHDEVNKFIWNYLEKPKGINFI